MVEVNKWVMVTDQAREKLAEFLEKDENKEKVIRIFSAGHG